MTISFSLFMASCTFDVCSSKRMYVNAFDQFMKKVEKKQNDFTDNQWKEMDEKFERFSGECYDKFEADLTKTEKQQIIKHNLKYVVMRVKAELPFQLSKENQDKVDDFLDEVDFDKLKIKGEELHDVLEGLDKDKFQKAIKEFEKGFEKLGEAFEDIGKELKEIFEENSKEKK